jgi:phenylalanyl-tRNA synthetase beta chain
MLIPQLLKNALFNIHHGQKNLKLFEQTKVFTRQNEKLATEKMHLSALITGTLHPVYWKEDQRPVDFYDVKGIVEEIIDTLYVSDPVFKASNEKFYQPGLAVDIFLKERMVGSFGKIDSKIASKYDIEQPLFVLDIKLQDIFELQKSVKPVFHDIPKFPPVLRDLSFIIPKKYSYNEIMNSIYSINKKLITKAELFDEYIGKNIKNEYRSLTFSLVFSSDTKTLTDDYINNILQKVIKKLKSDFSIEMR